MLFTRQNIFLKKREVAAQTLQPLSGLTCVLMSLSKVIYVYAIP